MFRITEDPSSGSLVQYLPKIKRTVLPCLLTLTWSVLWQHIVTRCVRVCGSLSRKVFCIYIYDRAFHNVLRDYKNLL